jgi:hypothetical protein
MPNFYRPPLGLPLYWRDEVSGALPAAIRHYFDWCCGPDPDDFSEMMEDEPLSDQELRLVIDYANYFINAPCWETNLMECEEMLDELRELRERAKSLASVESIRRWNCECMELGIDPF